LVFKGISIFVDITFSPGFSSAIANLIAAYSMTDRFSAPAKAADPRSKSL
jgi:hypothetical protein